MNALSSWKQQLGHTSWQADGYHWVDGKKPEPVIHCIVTVIFPLFSLITQILEISVTMLFKQSERQNAKKKINK